jgi:hypothetical protein
MRSGSYDGSRRNYFFPRIEQQIGTGLSRPVRMGSSMYLRFVVAEIDEDSERALGVFHAVWNLRYAGRLHAYEEDQHDMVRWWFSANLERPTLYGSQGTFLPKEKSGAVLV